MKTIRHIIPIVLSVLLTASSCTNDDLYLHYALKTAGENRKELKSVLRHYRTEDKDPLKLRAAKYLIANMPGHYSYADTAAINNYYRTALGILGTGPSPDWQRDTLRTISDRDYPLLMSDVVPDIEVITARFLIDNIDHAFTQWRTRPWAQHLTYDEFRDWILPYKVVELQAFDDWREVLSAHYSDSLRTVPEDDFERNSIYGAIEIARNEIHTKQSDIGIRVLWEERAGIPMRSAETWTHMTYGSCMDYVTMGTAVFRSMGLPAAVDMVPQWGRGNGGHSWYVFPTDRGAEAPTMNSLIVSAGMPFYTYEKIPKVWRKTYAPNRKTETYLKKSLLKHPFDSFHADVTDHYGKTSDIQVELLGRIKIPEKYVYIAMFDPSGSNGWNILDFGRIHKGKACFNNMGRNMLYSVLAYNGKTLIPVSRPFVLNTEGSLEYIDPEDETEIISVNLRRKYPESYNVVEQRRKLLGAQIQCATRPDFSDVRTLYTIESSDIPDKIELPQTDAANSAYRYWRYLAADGTYGSIAELAFFQESGDLIPGTPIACADADAEHIQNAFDCDWLTNFETENPDGNWIGMDFGNPVEIGSVRVVPRSDDNDIHPGDEYELFQFDKSNHWSSVGGRLIAEDNTLHYDSIPCNTLLWLVNHTRGLDERPFVVDENNSITWW